jgi:hypothetical protein
MTAATAALRITWANMLAQALLSALVPRISRPAARPSAGARHAAPPASAALPLGCRMQPGESEVNSGYLAGRKATWIWMATPGGALKPSTSVVL